MKEEDLIDLIIQLQYFLVRDNEEMFALFNDAYNQIEHASLTREETDAIYRRTVESKEFGIKLDEEFEKEKERNSGALQYAMWGT